MSNEVIINEAWEKLIKDISKSSNTINITDFLINDNTTKFELDF